MAPTNNKPKRADTFGSELAYLMADRGYSVIRILSKTLARRIYGDRFANIIEERALEEKKERREEFDRFVDKMAPCVGTYHEALFNSIKGGSALT